MVCLRGTLTNDLPDCQTFRSDDDGALYSLEGAPEGFGAGETVIVCGVLLDPCFSDPVRPLVVTSITRPHGGRVTQAADLETDHHPGDRSE